jgi:hypothetical protein
VWSNSKVVPETTLVLQTVEAAYVILHQNDLASSELLKLLYLLDGLEDYHSWMVTSIAMNLSQTRDPDKDKQEFN